MKFWKYQGAGNDFIMVDQRNDRSVFRENRLLIEKLCDRRFGIGADGLILLEQHPEYDFEMIYFNSDGRESSMCGNGGRCIAAFAGHLGLADDYCRFLAIDGEHEAWINPSGAHGASTKTTKSLSWIELKMSDVKTVEQKENVFILNTGSPHYVRFIDAVEGLDMVEEGRRVRYSERFKSEGINVNFAAVRQDGSLDIRTYERGVEDETLACGTGVTAAALAYSMYAAKMEKSGEVAVHAMGGDLSVRYKAKSAPGSFSEIWLCGPAQRVFQGEVSLPEIL